MSRLSPKLLAGIILGLVFGAALYLRIWLPYDQIFSGDWIKFAGPDAYYHMRLVDNLVYNFPHLISFDPYILYPGGAGIGNLRFFDLLLASVIWLIGLGSPTQHAVDIVGAYFPAVLGALTVVPIYFIGKELFNRWAGVISAGLIALLPSEFLGRSILGFTDHHVAEVLFTTVAMLFLILAVKSAKQKESAFDYLEHRDWTIIAKPIIYGLLAGLFLGLYLLTWAGALLFVFIIFVYFIVQFIIDHLRGRPTDYLCFVSTTTFTIALLVSLPASPDKIPLASLVIAILIPIALAGLSRLIASRGIRPIFYPVALLGFGLASLTIFHIINPAIFKVMVGQVLGIFAWPIRTTVLEMQPLFFPGGSFSLFAVWGNFTTGFFLSVISLGILIYFIIRRGEPDKALIIIWSLVMLAATLAMRRFAYYFAVNVALLTGYLSWQILEFTGFKRLVGKPVETSRTGKGKAKGKKRQKGAFRITASHIYMAFGAVVVFFLSFFPNISPAVATASAAQSAPSDAWCQSLSWLKDNTPEPFGDPDFYYEFYNPPLPGERYGYPETAYGVVAWWDYGYWITRLGHRMPYANPGTGHRGEAPIFAAQDEASANKRMDKDKPDSRYVIVNYDIAMVTHKFHAIATLSGSSIEEFADVYYQREKGKLNPIGLYHPEYYHSLVVRLYNFNGSQVIPKSSTVISYQEEVGPTGETLKEITNSQLFPSYEEAEAYVSSQQSSSYQIVGTNPFDSPVPLEPLEHYKLVYSSDSSIMKPDGGMISEVKIFEYVR